MTRVGSLCTGYGGLDLALGETPTWVCDTSPAAARLLAHRWPDVPNLGDLTAVDWTAVPPVDVVTCGFPCQPVSVAGMRRAMADERWLWDDIAVALTVLRPRRVVLENVRGLLSAGGGHAMGRVLATLADLGYVGSWRLVSASDIGAPHRRQRVFIVARPDDTEDHEPHVTTGDDRGPALGGAVAGAATRDRGRDPAPGAPVVGRGPGDAAAADPGGRRHGRREARPSPEGSDSGTHTWGPYEPAVRRWERVLGRPAPAPTADGRLSPRFVEWLMGLPDGWVCDVPGLSRSARLSLLGNGVVPQQAAHAIRLLDGTVPVPVA